MWARSGVPDSPSRAACAPPTSSRSPLKKGPEEGVGEQAVLLHKCCFGLADRTVTQLLPWSAPSRRGKCCPFFSLCVFFVSGSVSFVVFSVLLFLGSLFEKIFGSELLFLCVGVGRVFFGAVLPMFLLYYSFFFAPETVLKKFSWCQVWCFCGGLLSSFGFFADVVVLVFFERERSGSNRAHPHTRFVLFVLVLFVVPAAFVRSPFLAVRPASWRFFGVPFWAPRVFGILLVLFCPFSGREAARVFLVASFFCFCFPFCCVLRLFSHQLEGADPSSYVAYPRVVVPAPRPSEGPGAPSSATGWPRS